MGERSAGGMQSYNSTKRVPAPETYLGLLLPYCFICPFCQLTCVMRCPCIAPRAAQAPAESRFLLHANIFS